MGLKLKEKVILWCSVYGVDNVLELKVVILIKYFVFKVNYFFIVWLMKYMVLKKNLIKYLMWFDY